MQTREGVAGYGETGAPLPAWRGRRAVLRAGFGCVLALLVFSTVEAYRIQGSVSDRHAEVYRRYLDQDGALSQLRRNILLGSTYIRDFFMSTRPERAQVYRNQIRELQSQNRHALALLDDLQTEARRGESPRATVEDYWRTLELVAKRMELVTPAAAYDFIQEEVVPRRTASYSALRQLTETYQREMQLQELKFSRTRKAAVQRLAVLLGVCVVLGILVAWVTMRHAEILVRETTRHYAEQMEAKRELERLSARLLEIQEEERRRLSHGLHDEIGQTLTALRIEISHALARSELPEVRERLGRARALAERTVQTVRDISLLLRPSLLDDLGLVPALQWHLEDFTRRSGVACEFQEAELPQDLPDAVKTCVYRVVQEALNNCEKHASASRVWVTLRVAGKRLVMEVRDDGRGFHILSGDMPRRREGIGLLGMRERAAGVGGQLVLESEPGQGTRVCLEIPLPNYTPTETAEAALGS
ncbi:MAG TPA: sensor histidine kinase [Bryobacteraceae bacterium]|nr:sensor histidine kinase [Bryobacteraceae bacterium]